ncbi:MAG: DUF4270 family protein [Bacteroidota bacterium]
MNSMLRGLLAVIVVTLIFSLQNCTDPLDVGADLLDEDRASVGFTDTFDLALRTVVGDSVLTLIAPLSETQNDIYSMSNFLVGRTEDPYFGTTEASIYFEPRLLRSDLDEGLLPVENFGSNSVIDSVVLILPYDSTGSYGRLDMPFTLEAYEVTERIIAPSLDSDSTAYLFYSDVSLQTGALLGSKTFVPDFQDTVFIREAIVSAGTDTVAIRFPHLRIPLDPSLGQFILSQDTSIMSPASGSDEPFLDFFNGIHVKASSPTQGLLSFAMLKGLFSNAQSVAGIQFYYRTGLDTLNYRLEVRNAGLCVNTYQHDYTGSFAGAAIDDPSMDELLFLQGLAGTYIALELPNVKNFTGRIINQAQLELTIADVPGYDTDFNRLIDQIRIFYFDEDGNQVQIEDVDRQFEFQNFGGRLVELDDGREVYRMNIGIHTQFLIDGSVPETLYLRPNVRAGNPARVIFRGPGAAENRAVLKVSYTDL